MLDMVHTLNGATRDFIVSLASDFGLQVSLLDGDLHWANQELAVGYVPVAYLPEFVDFKYEYLCTSRKCVVTDISLRIIDGGQPVGVWLLTLEEASGSYTLSTYGQEVLPPLFAQNLGLKRRKSLVKNCVSFLMELARQLGVSSLRVSDGFDGGTSEGISPWHEQCLFAGGVPNHTYEMFADLRMSMEDYRKRIRKSYKPLVSSGLRIWNVEVIDQPTKELWREFQSLHFRVAGVATRADSTWDLQRKAALAKSAFLVSLRNKVGDLVGAGLFYTSQHEAYYGTGVYDRALFNRPLGHVVQYTAIERMRQMGLGWYRLGARPFVGSDGHATEKERSIADFKHGFATHVFPRFFFDLPLG